MPPLSLSPDAIEVLENYPWPGNIRQLKNTTEQMSILEQNRSINADTLIGVFARISSEQIACAPPFGG